MTQLCDYTKPVGVDRSCLVCQQGEIQWCDEHMAELCGYTGPQQLCGLHIRHLIPAFLCPDPSKGLTKVSLFSAVQKKMRSRSFPSPKASLPIV